MVTETKPARCPEHVGDLYPPRCYDCEALQTRPPIKAGMCSKHPDYPSSDRWPCAKCERADTDRGVRCDRHRDQVFPVDCAACESLDREYTFWKIPAAVNATPQTNKTKGNTNVY